MNEVHSNYCKRVFLCKFFAWQFCAFLLELSLTSQVTFSLFRECVWLWIGRLVVRITAGDRFLHPWRKIDLGYSPWIKFSRLSFNNSFDICRFMFCVEALVNFWVLPAPFAVLWFIIAIMTTPLGIIKKNWTYLKFWESLIILLAATFFPQNFINCLLLPWFGSLIGLKPILTNYSSYWFLIEVYLIY